MYEGSVHILLISNIPQRPLYIRNPLTCLQHIHTFGSYMHMAFFLAFGFFFENELNKTIVNLYCLNNESTTWINKQKVQENDNQAFDIQTISSFHVQKQKLDNLEIH